MSAHGPHLVARHASLPPLPPITFLRLYSGLVAQQTPTTPLSNHRSSEQDQGLKENTNVNMTCEQQTISHKILAASCRNGRNGCAEAAMSEVMERKCSNGPAVERFSARKQLLLIKNSSLSIASATPTASASHGSSKCDS
eukprot:1184829-Prorocentrum_minimum.AAC.3